MDLRTSLFFFLDNDSFSTGCCLLLFVRRIVMMISDYSYFLSIFSLTCSGSRSNNSAITSCSCSFSSSSSSVASSSSSSPSPLNRTPNYRFISFFATESDIVPWCTLENRIEVKIGFSMQSGGPGSASHLVNPPISSKRKSSKSKFQTVTPMDITDLVSRGPCSEISSIESNRLLQFFLKFKDSRSESAMSKPVMYFLLALADYYSPVEVFLSVYFSV